VVVALQYDKYIKEEVKNINENHFPQVCLALAVVALNITSTQMYWLGQHRQYL
jgi:hypothetical protein